MKLFFFVLLANLIMLKNINAAEAGMPQLNPEYWFSQIFWLIIFFIILYLAVSKIYLPKIKNNLDNREKKIRDDLGQAKDLKELSEKKNVEYLQLIEKAKKKIEKNIADSKIEIADKIEKKRENIENEIEVEITKAQKEIAKLKIDSVSDIKKISEDLTSEILEKIIGDKLNNSSVKATVDQITKKELNKLL